MGEFEEETYSTVFTALRHPVRRRILRTLSQGSRTFTDMQNSFKVNGAVLTYHLDAMKDLICKLEDGKYCLSTMGEGAMALMERVEEPPEVAPTKPSPKSSRRLSILQSATICISLVLLVSGTYLASISSIQEFYDVPGDWSLSDFFYEYAQYDLDSGVWTSLPDFWEDIDGNSYDVRYSLLVDPSSQLLNQLTKEHEADIYVNLGTNETAPSALYFIDLHYYQFAFDEYGRYRKKSQTFQGELQPVKNPVGLAFSTHISLPYTFAPSSEVLPPLIIEDQCPTLLESIWVNIYTNTTLSETITDATMADFVSVKASATEEFYSETRPYESQGNIIIISGIILLVAALMMSILSLLRK